MKKKIPDLSAILEEKVNLKIGNHSFKSEDISKLRDSVEKQLIDENLQSLNDANKTYFEARKKEVQEMFSSLPIQLKQNKMNKTLGVKTKEKRKNIRNRSQAQIPRRKNENQQTFSLQGKGKDYIITSEEEKVPYDQLVESH